MMKKKMTKKKNTDGSFPSQIMRGLFPYVYMFSCGHKEVIYSFIYEVEMTEQELLNKDLLSLTIQDLEQARNILTEIIGGTSLPNLHCVAYMWRVHVRKTSDELLQRSPSLKEYQQYIKNLLNE